MSWQAHLHLQYQRDTRGHTVLHHQHQGPLRVFKSLYPEGPQVCHNVIVHPPGGLVQGDQLHIQVEVEPGAHALISTPGATRFYRNNTGERAEQRVQLHLANGARLEWLPLETLAYDGCRALNQVELAIEPGAELLAWDVLSLGLPAAQLPFQQGTLQQNWQWPGVWLEQAKIDANDHRLLHSPVGLAGHSTMATLLLATGSPYSRARREHLLEHCRNIIEAHPLAQQCGATCPNEHVLLVRALASQVEPLMQLWQQLWAMLRREAWGMANVAPRIWSV